MQFLLFKEIIILYFIKWPLKKPFLFLEIIKRNNRIRNVINDCKTDNVNDIQDENERDDAISYLKNRGCIFLKFSEKTIEL